jgi:hypothetical protein
VKVNDNGNIFESFIDFAKKCEYRAGDKRCGRFKEADKIRYCGAKKCFRIQLPLKGTRSMARVRILKHFLAQIEKVKGEVEGQQ